MLYLLNKFKFIIFCLLIILLSFCSKQSIAKEWYLIGGNIQLLVDMDNGILKIDEDGDLIFKATILEFKRKEAGIQLSLKMEEVSSIYQSKYQTIKDFIVWIYPTGENQIKFLFSSFFNKPYLFSTSPIDAISNDYIGRAMGKEEFENFKNSLGSNIFSQYKVNINSNYEPSLSSERIIKNEKQGSRQWLRTKYLVPNSIYISDMIDYTKDGDYSTGFITKDPIYLDSNNKWNIDYTILDKNQETPLNKGASIRAVLINTGNLENKAEYSKYKRPKKISIYFANDYIGGLGKSQANFNNVVYSFEMPDIDEPYVIIFYNLINAKAIRVNVDSYYLGETNEASLFDLVFYTDNSNTIS